MLVISSFSSPPHSYHHVHHDGQRCRGHASREQPAPNQLGDFLRGGRPRRVSSVVADLDQLFAGVHAAHQRARQQQLLAARQRQYELEVLAHLQRQRQLQLAARRREEVAQELERRRQLAIETRRQQHLRQQRLSQELNALAEVMAAVFVDSQTAGREVLSAQPTESVRPDVLLQRNDAVRRVRFAEPRASSLAAATPTATSTSIPAQDSASPPTSTTTAQPESAPAVSPVRASQPSTAAANKSVRIPIRAGKGKASSHVRINAIDSQAAPTATQSPSPTAAADAHAALNLLSSDLDDYLSPSHVWPSPAHRTHALNQLLEQVDAVESDGEESVRGARRGLVHRVEQALDGQQESREPDQAKGITIREPDTGNRASVAAPAGDNVSAELVGYDVPIFDDAAPLATPTPAASAVTSGRLDINPPGQVASEWTTVDPTAPHPLNIELIDEDDSAHPHNTAIPRVGDTAPSQIDSVESSLADGTSNGVSESLPHVGSQFVGMKPDVSDEEGTDSARDTDTYELL